jgi:ABC-2 type transport system permease protein
VIGHVVDALDLRLSGVSQPPLSLEQRDVSGHSFKYYDFLLPGLVGLGVMTFSITALAVAISRFREQRILKRILATPLPPRRFVMAQVLARLVLAIVQAGLILAVGVVLFHAHIYGNLLWVLLLVALGNLVFLNIGFLIAARASGPDAAQGIAQAITLPMMFLSGVFFSTDTLPSALQKIVHYLPLTPLLVALRKVVNDGRSITATGHQVLLLAAWGVGSFILAARTFRFADA